MLVHSRKMGMNKIIILLVIATAVQSFTISNGDQSSTSTTTSRKPIIGLSGGSKIQRDTKYASTGSTTSARPSFLGSSNTGEKPRSSRDTYHQTAHSEPTKFTLDESRKSPASQLKNTENHRASRDIQSSTTGRSTLLGSSVTSTTRTGLLGSSQYNPAATRDQNRSVRETPTSSTTRSGLLGSATSSNIQHPASYQNRGLYDSRSSTTSRSGLLYGSNGGTGSPRKVRETSSTTIRSDYTSSTSNTDLTREARDIDSSSTSTTASYSSQGNAHPAIGLYPERRVRETETTSTTIKSETKDSSEERSD